MKITLKITNTSHQSARDIFMHEADAYAMHVFNPSNERAVNILHAIKNIICVDTLRREVARLQNEVA